MDNLSNANNNLEFIGLTQNECFFQGRVVGDPVIQSDNYAFFQLKTSVGEIGDNGQWNDVIIQIPIITTDPKKVNVLRKWVPAERTLLVNAYYKPWIVDGQPQHAFMAKKISLGPKKYVPNQDAAAPGLPVQ